MLRLEAGRQALRRLGADAVLVAPGDTMRYLLGFSPVIDERPCLLAITHAGTGLFVPQLNERQFREALGEPGERGLTWEVWTDEQDAGTRVGDFLRRMGIHRTKRVAVDGSMPAATLLPVLRRLGGEFVDLGPALEPFRAVKDAEEAGRLRRSASLADAAMEAGWAALRPGASERQVAAAILRAFQEGGAERVDFALVAAGPNGALPHHHTSSRPVAPGEPVVMDIGATLDGYCSDLTRVAVLGEPEPEVLRVHAVVEAAVQAALAAIRPGAVAAEVDLAARRVIEEAGYGPYFTHRLGHGIGLATHEAPWIHRQSRTRLEPGMFFSVEPGVYLPGRWGIRLEEIVEVGDEGARVLSRLPRELHRVDP
ncbi:MAG: Xaa-Pro peptidase family protein [Firmicutes bacterium]|nr:Xaa-Pro peptidase family protein [Bacillota bacterium]